MDNVLLPVESVCSKYSVQNLVEIHAKDVLQIVVIVQVLYKLNVLNALLEISKILLVFVFKLVE